MATEQQINDLETALETLANSIYNYEISLSRNLEAITEADENLETIKAAHLSDVLTARFEINNKLQYTNDDQRKVAVIEALNNDANYIAMETARKTLIQTQSAQKAEIEKTRNLHKAKLLVLQFYSLAPYTESGDGNGAITR